MPRKATRRSTRTRRSSRNSRGFISFFKPFSSKRSTGKPLLQRLAFSNRAALMVVGVVVVAGISVALYSRAATAAFSWSGKVTSSHRTASYSVPVSAAGTLTAKLTWTKAATLSLILKNSAGTVVDQKFGLSPIGFTDAVTQGTYTLTVTWMSGNARVPFTLSGTVDTVEPSPSPSPSPSVSPSPTPTPSPTSSPTPSPTPISGGGTSCPVPQFTRPSCTGVPTSLFYRPYPTASSSGPTNFFPAATVDHLTHVTLNYGGDATHPNDSYAVTTPNAVIDGLYIPGTLLIMADNVTVKNTYIQGMVTNEFTEASGTVHHPFTITDSTIWPAACTSTPGPAINGAHYTARRIQVFNHDKGFNSSSPGYAEVYDSYALLCWNTPAVTPPDGSHSGGFDALCQDGTCYATVFNHNTIDNRWVDSSGTPQGDTGMTYMAFGPLNGATPNVTDGFTANNNLVMGGAYTIMFWWNGGSKYEIHDNSVVNGAYSYGPADTRNSCSGQNWSGNTLVTIDSTYDIPHNVPTNYNYNVTSTVAQLPCVD